MHAKSTVKKRQHSKQQISAIQNIKNCYSNKNKAKLLTEKRERAKWQKVGNGHTYTHTNCWRTKWHCLTLARTERVFTVNYQLKVALMCVYVTHIYIHIHLCIYVCTYMYVWLYKRIYLNDSGKSI